VGIVEELVEIWLNEVCDRRQEREEEMFRRGDLPGRFTAKKLFGWTDKRYDKEY